MTSLAAISLGAPLMLLGIAAITLPIAAHLMSRRTRQRIVFPTIRLLLESRATQSNLYRIRRWILLLLRCLALIMIALAFTMPSCTPQQPVDAAEENKTGGAAVVFIIDTSVSLARDPQTTGGTALLHSMQAIAQRTLASLQPGVDRVNVIFAQGQPRALFQSQAGRPMLSTNHAAAREGLSQFELSFERADLRGALVMAGEMLQQAQDASHRRIVILSDMQQSNWSDVALMTDGASPLPTGTVVTLLPLKIDDDANIALSDPRSEPAMPVVNQQTLVITKVTNHSSQPRDVTVAAQVDGQPIGTRTVALLARESREVAIETIITTPGHHRIEFSVPDDALPADNRSHLAIEATQRVLVLVVGDDDPSSLGSASYFIARALSPRGDQNDLIEVRHLLSIDPPQTDLSRAQAVLVSEVGALSEQTAGALARYLHDGGGVIFYSDGAAVPGNLVALNRAANQLRENTISKPGDDAADIALIPWKATQLRDFSSSPQGIRITQGLWNSPVLTEFDEQAQRTLSQIRFHRAWSVSDVNPLASVLLRFTDETPALGMMGVGRGRLIVANFSPSLTASALGKYGSFVALSHSLVRHVRPRLDHRRMAVVGQPVVANVPIPVGEQPGAFIIESPQGQPLTPELSRTHGMMSVLLPRTQEPGFHRVLRNDQPAGDVAVNIDPRESDLRAIDNTALAARLQATGISVGVQGTVAGDDVLSLRGQPLWHWFVIAAMGLIGLELALLSFWNR